MNLINGYSKKKEIKLFICTFFKSVISSILIFTIVAIAFVKENKINSDLKFMISKNNSVHSEKINTNINITFTR